MGCLLSLLTIITRARPKLKMMKSSSSTNTSLNSSKVSIGSPRNRLFNRNVLGYLLTLSLFCFLIKLGFWQLERGHEKQTMEQQLQLRQQQAPVSFDQILLNSAHQPLTGFNLSVKALPTDTPIFLLDNQTFNNRVGYLAYQVMQVSAEQPWLLVELGFIPVEAQRSVLPSLQPFTHSESLSGRVYQRHLNPLSHQLLAEAGNPTRIQNLNIQQLSQYINHPLAPIVLQPKTVIYDQNSQPLGKPWQPLPLSSDKHFGYAVQWFSMASALLFIGLFVFNTHRKKQE